MTDEDTRGEGYDPDPNDVVEIELAFASMRRFQAEFSQNLATDGLFIDTGEPLEPGTVVRFRVILPEDFVYLEGTAVVEWARAPESAAQGVPGMALRFVAMSPQNEELVEQLVAAHVEAGGSPFDVDYRPQVTDYPTDALEGIQATDGSVRPGETYRVTIRSKGEDAAAAALQALAESGPVDDRHAGGPGVVEDAGLYLDEPESSPAEGFGSVLDSLDGGRKQPVEAAETADGHWNDRGLEVEEEPIQEREDFALEETGQPREEFPEGGDLGFLKAPSDFDDGPEVLDDTEPPDAEAGPVFEVSLPLDDDEADTTPRLSDEASEDVTVASGDSQPRVARSSSRSWILTLVAVIIIAAAVVVWWPTITGGLRQDAGPSKETAAVEPTASETDSAAEPPADDGVGAMDAGAREVVGADSPAEIGAATGEPAARHDELSTRADTVIDIGAQPGDGSTVVTIRGNGGLGEGSITMSSLASPPRLLIKVVGISSPYRPYTLDVSSSEVSTIRIGHHQEVQPPELWVVLDLTAPGLAVTGVDIRGETAELVIGRR